MKRKEYDYTRKPEHIAAGLRRCLRRLNSAREMLALEAVSEDLALPVAVTLEHIAFLEADLRHDIENFEARYGIGPQVPHKGVR